MSNKRFVVAIALYFIGAIVLTIIFAGASPSRAWSAVPSATWWDEGAMLAMLAWGIGGLGACFFIADR